LARRYFYSFFYVHFNALTHLLIHSELLEFTTWKIKFAQQEDAAIRSAKRKQEEEEELRKQKSIEAGIQSFNHLPSK